MPNLSPAAVRKQIKTGKPDRVYLLQGEDDVEKAALGAEFAELVEEDFRPFNVERIHAADMTTGDRLLDGVSRLVDAVRTLPMMGPTRVVIVLQADVLLGPTRESDTAGRARDQIEALLENPEPTATLVLIAGTLDKRSRLYKLLQKQATIVDCGTVETQEDAEHWIRAHVSASGVQIEAAAARLLAERAGPHLQRLRSEVDRLLLYALGQQTVTVTDAQQLAGPMTLQDQWALANAVEAGQGREALHQLALALDAGAAPEQLLGQLGWVVRAKFPRAAPAHLMAGIEALFRTDQELKRSNRSTEQPRILLERLVVELCAGPRALRPL